MYQEGEDSNIFTNSIILMTGFILIGFIDEWETSAWISRCNNLRRAASNSPA